MKIKQNDMIAVVSTDICGVNNREMRQMHEMAERVDEVLQSHKGAEKKQYLTDDELRMILAILRVLTEGYGDSQTSAFDDLIKEWGQTNEFACQPVQAANAIPSDEDE